MSDRHPDNITYWIASREMASKRGDREGVAEADRELRRLGYFLVKIHRDKPDQTPRPAGKGVRLG